MPENIETRFTPTGEEKPKPLEAIKEKAALRLAEEIEERMKQEGKTDEGYNKITKLLNAIRKIYEEKRIVSWGKIDGLNEIFSKDFENNISYLSFSPSGTEIMVREGNKGLGVYDRETGNEIFSKKFENNIYYPSFSPSGTEIMVKEGDGGLRIYEIKGQER